MLSEKLARLQAERGETNYRLAKKIGVHQSSIANWKLGKTTPHPKHVRMLADYFGVTVDDLLTEDDNKEPVQ